MRQLIGTLALLATTIHWSTPLLSQTNDCSDHIELLLLDESHLDDVRPCDYIGAYYLLGLGAVSINLLAVANTEVSQEYFYYHYFRLYLNAVDPELPQAKEEALAFLLLGLSFLPNPTLQDTEGEIRGNFYTTFALGEYWDSNNASLSESKLSIQEAMLSLMAPGNLPDVRHLGCFIQYDIPTLPIADILESKNYKGCLEAPVQ